MLKKQILQRVSSESMNLCFDGSVMSGDVDVMWESVCQVPVSQLVLVCYEPQFIAQIYGPCGSKCIERHRERTLRWFNRPSHCTTSTVSAPVVGEENNLSKFLKMPTLLLPSVVRITAM